MQRLENWNDLRYFLAVARHGGLGPASRALRVNQSTVFRRIGKLEESLNARLFERQPRGYVLTAIGESMLVIVERIEDDILTLDRTVLGADAELRGTVRVTTVDEVLVQVIPHFKAFRDQYPGIDLEVVSEQRLLSLSRREADVAIRPGGKPTEPDIVGRKLVALPIAAYAAPAYLAGRSRPRRASDLSKHRLINFDSSYRAARHLDAITKGARVCYRSNSMTGHAMAARAGVGVALLPRFMGDADEQLERLFVVRSAEVFHLWLLVHADLRQTARVRAFVDFVTEAIVAERSVYEGARKRR